MAALVGALRANLSLDSKEFVAGTELAKRASKQLDSALGKVNTRNVRKEFALAGQQSKMVAMQLSQVFQQFSASGNFTRALAIQLPDMAMGFGAVGMAAGVVAGMVLPALVDMFSSTGEEVKSTAETMKDAAAAVRAYSDAADSAAEPMSALIERYGTLAGAVHEARIQSAELAREDARRSVDSLLSSGGFQIADPAGLAALNAMKESFRAPSEEMQKLVDLAGQTQFEVGEIARQYQLTSEEALNLATAAQRVRDSAGQGAAEQVAAASSLVDYMIEIYGSADAANQATGGLVDLLNAAVTAAADVASIDMAGPIGAAAGEAGRLANNLLAASLNWGKVANAGGVDSIASAAMQKYTPNPFGSITGGAGGVSRSTRGGGGGGGGAREEAASIGELIAKLQEEMAVLEEQTPLEGELLKYREAMANATDEERAQVMALIAARDEEQRKLKELDQAQKALTSTMESAFTGLVTGAMSFKQALGQVISKLAEMLAQSAFEGLMAGGGDGLVGGFLKMLGFADGGVFSGGRVQAFATGGIVSGATAFGMQGGLGVMGEAGPEAIMPLARGRGGKLGVIAQGGGGRMQIEIVENPMFAARVEGIAQGQAVAVTRKYDREIAPLSRNRSARERG